MKVTRKSARALQALVFLVAIALVATAIPAVLYGNLPLAEAADVTVSSEQQLRDALNNPNATKITLSGDINLTGYGAAYHNAPRFTVPAGRTVELNLNGHSIRWNEIYSGVGGGAAKGILSYGNNATSNSGGYKYILLDNQGTLNITGSGTIGMDFQAGDVNNDDIRDYNNSAYMHYAGAFTVIRNSGTLTVGSNVNITVNLLYTVSGTEDVAGDIYVTVNGIYQTAGEVNASGNIKASIHTRPNYVKKLGYRSPGAGYSFAYGIYAAGGVVNYIGAAGKSVDIDVYTCLLASGGNVTAYKNSCLQLSAVGFYTNNPASQFIGANIDCHVDYGDDYNQNQGDNILSSSRNNVSAIGVQYTGNPPIIGSGTNINTSTTALASMTADGNIAKTKKPVNQSSEPPMNFMDVAQNEMPNYWGVDSDDPAPKMQEDQGHTTTNNSYKDESGNTWTPDDGESSLNGGIPNSQLGSVNKVMIASRYYNTSNQLVDYEITAAATDVHNAIGLSNVAGGRATVGQAVGYTGGGEVKNSNFYELRTITANSIQSGAVATDWYTGNGMTTLALYDKTTNTINAQSTMTAAGGQTTLVYANYYEKPADSIRFNVNNVSVTDAPVTAVEVEYTGEPLKFGEDLFLHVYKENRAEDDPTAAMPFGNDVEITSRFSNIGSGSTVATYQVYDANNALVDTNTLPTRPGTYTVKVTAAGETTYSADPAVSMNFAGNTFDFTLIIRPRDVVITQIATPELTYGQRLDSLSSNDLAKYFTIDSGIVGLTADGVFSWVTPDVIPPVGTNTYQLRWTNNDGLFETQVLDSVTVNVVGANLSVQLNPKSIKYGEELVLTQADVTFGTAIVPGEEEMIFNLIKDSVQVNGTAYVPGSLNAGQYTYTLSATTAGNYSLQVIAGNLIINKAQLTVTAPAVTKTYDGTGLVDISFDASCVVSGLYDVYGATGVMIDTYVGAPLANNGAVGSTTASINKNSMTLSGAKYMNYEVGTVTNATTVPVTVVPAAPKVDSLILDSYTITYDPTKTLSQFAELNDTAGSGVIKVIEEGTTLSDGVTLATPGRWVWKEDVKPTVNQRTYIAVFEPDDTNYAPLEQEITLSVQKREITVRVTMTDVFYGGDQPVANYVFDGFPANSTERINYTGGQLNAVGFTLSGNVFYTCAYSPDDPANKNAGVYPISLTSTLSSDNYAFVPAQDCTLTVKPKDLTITPNPVSVTYGTALTENLFSLNVSGWVTGDEDLASQLNPVYNHSVVAGSDVSEYPLSVVITNTNELPNYNLVCTEGKITVTKAVLTVSADNIQVAYGAAQPNYTYTITGYQAGDSAAVITGAPALSSSYNNTSPAGSTFPIVVNTAGMSATNYAFTVVGSATLTVVPAVVSIQTEPTFTVENGKTLADAVIATAGVAVDEQGQPVSGTFRIDNRNAILEYQNNGAQANRVTVTFYPDNQNYATVSCQAAVEVLKRQISGQPSIEGSLMVGATVQLDVSTLDPSSMTYYDPNSIVWSVGGQEVATGSWTFTLTEDHLGQTVTVSVSPFDNSGYDGTASFTTTIRVSPSLPEPGLGQLNIPQSEVRVTYDKQVHAFTVNATDANIGDITVRYNGTTTEPVNAGTYVVTVDIGTSAVWAPVSGLRVGTLVIEPRPVYVVFTAADKTYDGKVNATVSNIDASRGVISGDQVSVNTSAASFEFKDVNAGYQEVEMKYAYLEGTARNNYVIEQEPVYANILQKEITATAYAADQNYDEDNYDVFRITFGSPVGLVAGDQITLNATTGRVGNNAAGQQDVIHIDYTGVLTGADSGNYTFLAANDGSLRVNILRVAEPGMEYPNPINTTYSSMQRLDDLSGGLPIGWSWADPTIVPTVRQKSYQAVYTPSNPSYLTETYEVTVNVSPVEVTIIPDSISIEYGSPVPNLTYTTEGFTGDDDASVCSGMIIVTTNYRQGNDVGSYEVSVAGSTISNPNYTFVKSEVGVIEVTAREIVVTPTAEDVVYDPDNHSVPVTFAYTGVYVDPNTGEDDVRLSFTETVGTLANNNAGSQLVNYTLPVLEGSAAGNYTLRVSGAAIRINVQKADPVVTWPTSAEVEFGQRFSTAVFDGGEGEGSFMFVDSSRVASDLNGGYFEVRFTPTDTGNYNSLTQQVLLRVKHAELNMSVSVSGTLYEGQTLTAAVSGVPQDALQYLHYAWYRVSSDGTAVLVSDASSYELGAGDVGYYIRLDVSSDPTAPYSGEASFITVRPVEEEQLTFWEKLVRWFYSILAAIQALFDTMFAIGM